MSSAKFLNLFRKSFDNLSTSNVTLKKWACINMNIRKEKLRLHTEILHRRKQHFKTVFYEIKKHLLSIKNQR